jgi:signal transduction histidine kinase
MVRRKSIRTRLILMVATLMVAAFVAVFAAFKLLITNYIENNANEILSTSTEYVRTDPRTGDTTPDKDDKKPAGKAEAVIISSDYEILFPTQRPLPFESSNDFGDFTDALKAEQPDLSSGEIRKVQTDSGLFYYNSMASRNMPGAYAVFYINMTDMYQLETNLSRLLWITMLVALAGALVAASMIAARITGPIKHLSSFARRIGDGDYAVLDEDFKDLELHDLKNVMNDTTRKLEDYDTEQRVFFQNVSHELRTPLQIIKNNAEGIEHDLLDKDRASSLIRQETDKLSELVEDIIYLSRLEARSRDMEQSENDLRETLSYTVERYSTLLKKNGVNVLYDFQDEPVMFTYDEKSIERAFQNLLSNAVRYAKDEIKVSCREMDGRIVVSVADNGKGIKEDELPRIFDRFYKGENGVHGIGLSIVKSIVNSYGGRIEVETGPGGTVFTVFFATVKK